MTETKLLLHLMAFKAQILSVPSSVLLYL